MKCATELSKVDLFGSLEGISAQIIEELEQLYISLTRVMGFNIKKYTQRTRKDIVVERYVCSCEGKTHYVDPSIQALEHPNKPKKIKLIPTTRYDCKARKRIKLYIEVDHIILSSTSSCIHMSLQGLNGSTFIILKGMYQLQRRSIPLNHLKRQASDQPLLIDICLKMKEVMSTLGIHYPIISTM